MSSPDSRRVFRNAPTWNSGDMELRVVAMQENFRPKPESQRFPDTPLPKHVGQLPFWPEPIRAVPNGFLRSALFGVIKKGRRRYLEGEQITAIDGVTIRYTGERLDQGDLDVWESALHIARIQGLGSECRFTGYAMMKLLGKSDAGTNRATLHNRLMRLKANAIEVQQGRYSYAGSLIDDVYRDSKTREYVLILNPKLLPLFAENHLTHVQWAIRQELDGKPMAQWLHGFYATHAKPLDYKWQTLLNLSGSENEHARSGKQKVLKALDAVTKASAKHHEVFAHKMIGDLVHVEKNGSKSQQRHLAKREKWAKKTQN